MAKLKTYIFFYSNIFFLQICPPAVFFTVDTKLCANKVVISLLIGFHNYSLQQGWKLSDSPFIYALRVSLIKDAYLMVGSMYWMWYSILFLWIPHKILVEKDGLTLIINRSWVIFKWFLNLWDTVLGTKKASLWDSGRH